LCSQFDEIAKKALTTPSNTEELMELQEFVKSVRAIAFLFLIIFSEVAAVHMEIIVWWAIACKLQCSFGAALSFFSARLLSLTNILWINKMTRRLVLARIGRAGVLLWAVACPGK